MGLPQKWLQETCSTEVVTRDMFYTLQSFGAASLGVACPGVQVLLVLGAAGGVGLAAVQLGKLLGARVIAVAR